MTDRAQQADIITALEVAPAFDPAPETERRIAFVADYLLATKARGLVLGISGGVDSTVGGRLSQLACERVRAQGGDARFIAVRLPYGVQKDETDAQAALTFIRADEVLTINILGATDAMYDAVIGSGITPPPGRDGFIRGNVKARERMIAQYTVAGSRGMLVVGTDQAAEALVGFFTKFGDGAADITPLFGLPKRRVRAIARVLGVPEHLVEKVPTADLEDDLPLLPDEVALGVPYTAIDDYLEGLDIDPGHEATILGWYRRTAHKRALPVTPGVG